MTDSSFELAFVPFVNKIFNVICYMCNVHKTIMLAEESMPNAKHRPVLPPIDGLSAFGRVKMPAVDGTTSSTASVVASEIKDFSVLWLIYRVASVNIAKCLLRNYYHVILVDTPGF